MPLPSAHSARATLPAVAFAALFCASTVRAATPAILVGPDLAPRAISIQGLSDGTLSFFDTDRHYRSEALEGFVQLRDIGQARATADDGAAAVVPIKPALPAAPPAPSGAQPGPATQPAPSEGFIELVDGQKLTGRFLAPLPDGQKFQWEHPLLGAVAINLDNVRSLRLRPRPAAPAPAADPNAPGDAGANAGNDPAANNLKAFAEKLNNMVARPPGAGPVPNAGPQVPVTPPRPAPAAPALKTPVDANGPDNGAANAGGNASATSDRVEMTNGDAVTGFVTAITAKGLELKTAERGQAVVLPLERVCRIDLTNPMQETRRRQHKVWLEDGSRLLASSLSITGKEMRLQPALGAAAAPAPPVSTPLAGVTRIDIAGKAGALAPLSSLASSVAGGGEAFGVARPPRVAGDSLRVHAPVTLAFELPTGAMRLAGQARLDTAAEPGQDPAQVAAQVRRWADLDMVLRLDDKEITRIHLDGKQPQADVNLPLDGRRLVIELTQGANGPVMDRVLLREFQLLIVPRP